MAELKFLKGAYSAYSAITAKDDNSFYVTTEQVEGNTMYALWLGANLIASGNTVAALEAEITRAKGAEKDLSDRIAAFEGDGAGSVAAQIKAAVDAEKAAREAAVNALTEDIEDLNADLNDEISARTDADEFLSGKIDTNIAAIEKLNGGANEEGSVAKAVADAKSGLLGDAAEDYNTLGKLEDKIQEVVAAAKSYKIAVVTGDELSALGTNVREAYKLVDEDKTKVGEYIKIYKDSSLKSVALDGQTLNFTYILADGGESTVGVDVSSFLAESEFANGLQVVDHVVSVKVADGSEDFLTVDANGIKLSGVQDAIDAAEAQALADAKAYTYDLAEGAVATNTAAIAKLNGTADEDGSVAKAVAEEAKARKDADDALSERIAKFETGGASVATQIANAIADLDATVGSQVVADGKHVAVEVVEVDGKLTGLTVTENDIASKVALEAEVTRADAAEKANAKAIEDEETRAISAETELNNAITAEINAREAAVNAINGKIGDVAADKTIVEMINDAQEAAEAAATKVVKDAAATHITLTEATNEETGAITYTIGESDIASKSDMDQKIQKIESDINFLTSGGTIDETLESIKEIDAYLKEHEGKAADMLTSITANANAIAVEKSRAEAEELRLNNLITAETNTRGEEITRVEGLISDENERAISAETALSDRIAVFEGDENEKGSVAAQIKAAVDAEASARTSADDALNGRLGSLEKVQVTGKGAIVVSANGATENKEVSLKLAEHVADTAGVNLTQDVNGLKATLEWGTF